MGLVIAEDVEPDECSDYPMLGIHFMYPMVAWDPMEKLE
jgi:hypothetical protein